MSRQKLAALQYTALDDAQANFRRIQCLAETATGQGASLLLLPENALFMGRRARDKLALAETIDAGPWQQQLADLARQLQVTLAVGSFPLTLPDREDKVSPSALVYGPDGSRLARYDKLHLFDVTSPDGTEYKESKTFQAGENTPQLFEFGGLKIGLSICYDLRFPELYRELAAQGADLLLVPAAFTHATGQLHWDILLRARAIENVAYVLAANQTGVHTNGQRSWGHSMCVGPRGQILAQLDEEEGICLTEVDLDALEKLRESFPVLQHRRL